MSTRRVGSLLALLVVFTVLLSGCSAPVLVEGTSVTVAVSQSFFSYNPKTSYGNSAANSGIVSATNSQFNYYDNTPKLVTDGSFGSYQVVSRNPFTVKYTIRDGVSWSDGTPVDAADLLLAWAANSGALNTKGFDAGKYVDQDTGKFTGAFPKRPGTDLYGLRTSNGSGNKIDYFLHRTIAYDVGFNPKTGETNSTATITLENQAPTTGQPDYVLGNEDYLRHVPNGRPYASNSVNFSLYSPLDVKSLTINGTRTGVQVGHELGVNVYSGTVTIPSGQSAQVIFELTGNLAPSASYRLLIDRQPVVHPDNVTTTVHSLAPDLRLAGTSTTKGSRTTAQLLETSIELTRRFTR